MARLCTYQHILGAQCKNSRLNRVSIVSLNFLHGNLLANVRHLLLARKPMLLTGYLAAHLHLLTGHLCVRAENSLGLCAVASLVPLDEIDHGDRVQLEAIELLTFVRLLRVFVDLSDLEHMHLVVVIKPQLVLLLFCERMLVVHFVQLRLIFDRLPVCEVICLLLEDRHVALDFFCQPFFLFYFLLVLLLDQIVRLFLLLFIKARANTHLWLLALRFCDGPPLHKALECSEAVVRPRRKGGLLFSRLLNLCFTFLLF